VVAEPKKKEHKPRKTKRSLYCCFELAYENIAVFRDLLTTISEGFTDEIPLQIQENALAIRVMDPSRVKLANYLFTKDMFEEWQVRQQNHKYPMPQLPVTVIVPVKEVLYAIEKAGKDARVRFEIGVVFSTIGVKTTVAVQKPLFCPKCGLATTNNQLPNNKRGKKGNLYKCPCGWRGKVRTWTKKVKTHETSVETDESTFLIMVKEKTEESWKINFLEDEYEEPPMPILRPEAQFKVTTCDFRAKVERLGKRMDTITFVGKPDRLILHGASDVLSGDIELKKSSDIVLELRCDVEQKATYPTNHLLSVLPKKTVAEVINLEYSKDMPIKITALTTLGDSTIEYFIAPRIESE